MRKAFAVALLSVIMISQSWADSFEVAPPSGNWNKVQSLPTNTDITMRLKHGEEVSGEFIRLAEDSIFVKEFEREKVFPRNAVEVIKRIKPGSRARNAAIVGGVVFGICFGLGYASAAYIADQNDMPAGERAAAGATIGGLLGGGAAAISLLHHPASKSEVIYRAR